MRTRTVHAWAWESTHAMPQLFGGAGIGTQRAVWTVAFRAEAAALSAQAHAVALLDLAKAFEKGAAPPLGGCGGPQRLPACVSQAGFDRLPHAAGHWDRRFLLLFAH